MCLWNGSASCALLYPTSSDLPEALSLKMRCGPFYLPLHLSQVWCNGLSASLPWKVAHARRQVAHLASHSTMRKSLCFLSVLLALAAGQDADEAPPEHESTPYTFIPGQGEQKEESAKDTGKGGKSRKELAEGLSFCEYDNCYELLGVDPKAGPIPIKRAYRKLAAEYHPDKCASGDIQRCREIFPKYANAYEVLSSSEMRKNYDYVLAHPYEFPGFYLKYSKPTYAPKTDLRFVFVVTIIAAAAVQHFLKKSQYEMELSRVKKDPRFRYNERLKEIIAREALAKSASPKKGAGGGFRGQAKESKAPLPKGEELEKAKKRAEEILESELAEELPPPPSASDNVAISLFKLPLTFTYGLLWVASGGMREPGYRTRRALGLSTSEWAEIDDEEQKELIGKELWVGENLSAYEQEVAMLEGPKGSKTGKEKRAARERKRQLRNPSAMQIDD